MKQLFIITLDPNGNSFLLREKIKELGDYYNIYNNQYIVCADYEDAQQLYEKLVPKGFPLTGIVVFSIPVNHIKYWGYSNKGLWEWLKNHIHS
ncbi:MAG: hypothetical protein IKO34_05900 [Bacteroidales bacterium]|jgi:hypothetical protein|nr:hypothetical protein [Bacteroidales bacterium]